MLIFSMWYSFECWSFACGWLCMLSHMVYSIFTITLWVFCGNTRPLIYQSYFACEQNHEDALHPTDYTSHSTPRVFFGWQLSEFAVWSILVTPCWWRKAVNVLEILNSIHLMIVWRVQCTFRSNCVMQALWYIISTKTGWFMVYSAGWMTWDR